MYCRSPFCREPIFMRFKFRSRLWRSGEWRQETLRGLNVRLSCLIFRKSPHRRQTDGHRPIIARTYNWDQVLAERSPRLVFLIKIEDYKAFYSARKGLRLGGLSSISQQNRPFPSFETGARGIWKGPRPNEPRVKRKGLRIYKLLYKKPHRKYPLPLWDPELQSPPVKNEKRMLFAHRDLRPEGVGC